MPANIDPIFTKVGNVGSVLITAANTSSQGGGTIGTDIFLVCTGDDTNGTLIQRIRFIPTATTPTTTTATVGRVFITTQDSGATTSANTYLWDEVTLPAVASDNASAAVLKFDLPFGFALKPGQNILATCHAAPAANTAWRVVAVAGDY